MAQLPVTSLVYRLIFPGTMAILTLILVSLVVFYVAARKFCREKRKSRTDDRTTVGFFHPYCSAGGGGERVLWCAIDAMQKQYPGKLRIVVYTGDLELPPTQILKHAEQTFSICLQEPVEFVYLHRRRWVEAFMYPYFTILGQSLGSMLLGTEALFKLVPDLYVDTTGYSFTLPVFKFVGGCRIVSYTHYPTITSDMMRRVSGHMAAHNNRPYVARSPFLTAGKLLYYRLFAWLYGWMGRCSDIVMVNSSWTEEHIVELWKCPLKTHRVYPPCDVEELKRMPLLSEEQENVTLNKEQNHPIKIISVGQFRPEKDHPLQLRAMYELRQLVSEELWDRIMLVFIGSCRNDEDAERVKDMQNLCKHLSLEKNVTFRVNVSYTELKKELQEGTIGLHAMWNEHFGIGVVECMAAGLIMVAHRSGGPLMDIVMESEGSRNGFLAADEAEYAQAIATIIRMSPQARKTIRNAARASVDRFSVQEFENGFLRAVEPFVHKSI